MADCTAYAYGNFHNDLLSDKVVLIGCPKFGSPQLYERKLSEIFSSSGIKEVQIVNMEVPCCFGLHQIVKKAMKRSNSYIPLKRIVISIRGKRMEEA